MDGPLSKGQEAWQIAREFGLQAMKCRRRELADEACFAMSDVPKSLMKAMRKPRADSA